MLLLINVDSYEVQKLAQEVDRICRFFLHPRRLSFFQFKRAYKKGAATILANKPEFFKEFLQNSFIEPTIHLPTSARQSSFCFWDESLSKDQVFNLQDQYGVYHGFTILNRRKDFYDCAAYAMSELHPNPVAYYLYILKDLESFSELFPTKASHLIKEALKSSDSKIRGKAIRHFYLPKRSLRFYIGDDVNNYITTYEALCVQLIQKGKSYKEIGAILSMASTTVKTHLIRLKARTGLSLQEISLRSFQAYKNDKNIAYLNKLKGKKINQ